MSYCFKITILAEICIKMRLFYSKNGKNHPALEAPPTGPLTPAPGGLPTDPQLPAAGGCAPWFPKA